MQEQRNTSGLSLFKTAKMHVSLHNAQLFCPWTEYYVILTRNQAIGLARIRLGEKYFHFKIYSSPGYFLTQGLYLFHFNMVVTPIQ